jgi:hypothetical protein
MDAKTKGLAVMLLSKGRKSGEGATSDEEETDDHELLAEDVLAAVKDGDASALSEALKAFILACDTAPDDE